MKTYLRNTMGQDRLNSVALINIERCYANRQGRSEGGKGAQFPVRRVTMGAPNHCGGRMAAGASNNPNNVTSTFFSIIHFLPKDLSFERGGAKLVS